MFAKSFMKVKNSFLNSPKGHIFLFTNQPSPSVTDPTAHQNGAASSPGAPKMSADPPLKGLD